jgi:hypothetical protein
VRGIDYGAGQPGAHFYSKEEMLTTDQEQIGFSECEPTTVIYVLWCQVPMMHIFNSQDRKCWKLTDIEPIENRRLFN